MIKAFLGPSGFALNCDRDGIQRLPPAKRGDLYSQARRPDTTAIAVIDGVFGTQPSVLHKEILWALSRGIPVYGASSIGAIRAAEMAQFGMLGSGWIFEAYQRGRYRLLDTAVWTEVEPTASGGRRTAMHQTWLTHLLDSDALTDDDDVALTYMPAELGYRPLSEPLVNMIKTFRAAPVGDALKRQALLLSKQTFFPRRSYADTLDKLRRQNRFDHGELSELADWTRDSPIDQKAVDARELLDALAGGGIERASTPRPGVAFIETTYWADLCPPSTDADG